MGLSSSARFIFISTALLLLFFVGFRKGRVILAYVLLNSGQRHLLEGQVSIDPYLQAFSLTVDNTYILKQTSLALLRNNRQEEAVLLLKSHLKYFSEPWVERVVYTNLIANQEYRDLLSLDVARNQSNMRSPAAAAAVLLARQYINAEFNWITDLGLLKQVFYLQGGTISATADLLNSFPREQNFWVTNLGKRLEQLLFGKVQLPLAREFMASLPNHNITVDIPSDSITIAHLHRLLKLDRANFDLGSELAPHGNFEQPAPCLAYFEAPWCVSQGWTSSFMDNGELWNLALFNLGSDNTGGYNDSRALRIDGLFLEKRDDREPARAGFESQAITIEPEQFYCISFVYRTEMPSSADDLEKQVATIWLSSNAQTILAGDYPLPATQDGWSHVLIIGRNRNLQEIPIKPLLRLWQEGTVWFDNFSIRTVVYPELLDLTQPIIDITSIEELQKY